MAKKKTILLAFLPILSLLVGYLEYGPARGSQYAGMLLVTHALLSIALILAWFLFDTKERNYKVSLILKVAVACLTVFALPYYLFRSRGFTGGLKALGLSLLVFVGTMVSYRIGTWFV